MLRLVFAVTLFVSAALLFVVQPMVAKMVLPLLGGTPAVWITCMVFFQAMLLAGYLYAHATTSWLGTRKQAVLHLVILVLPLAALPFMRLPLQLAAGTSYSAQQSLGSMLGPIPTEGNPTLWLLGLLLLCIGLPFFAVATSAPLLQKWFAATGHPDAADPYFLYGASNLGSMLALLSYPVVVEPLLRLPNQTDSWALGYGLLLVLTAVCAVAMWRSRAPAAVAIPAAAKDARPGRAKAVTPPAVTWLQRLHWIVLAFVPSSLLLGVTTYMSTDLAAIPLLWVIPLALYLLTFILVFSRMRLPLNFLAWTLPALILLQLIIIFQPTSRIWPMLLLHLITFFVASLVCHGELARRRPSPEHLTDFYLCMSVGGVLGGLFSAVLAPLIFNTVAEYPLELMLACLVGPPLRRKLKRSNDSLLNLGLPIVAGVMVAIGVIYLLPSKAAEDDIVGDPSWAVIGLTAWLGVLAYGAVTFFTDRPLLFGLSLGSVLLAGYAGTGAAGNLVYQKRTFFGVLRVTTDQRANFRKLFHGTTLHGAQSLDPERRDEPLAYYHREGPLGRLFASREKEKDARPIAVVGLGIGTIAAYGRPGQEMDFYDIDAEVVHIAENEQYFTFLRDSPARTHIILGDGRLSLARATDKHYGTIILDAFSSDAIPVHLLTREAVRNVYLHKLADNGLLLFHISNRYLDLQPVLADVARDAGLVCRVSSDLGNWDIGKAPSIWVVMARSPRDLSFLDERWKNLEGRPDRTVWTDDFSNVVRIVRWN